MGHNSYKIYINQLRRKMFRNRDTNKKFATPTAVVTSNTH